uniref:uncharacterized protein LOC105353132 n=1 Tax=Fragaria vesca subsp. vesca TaxID=101020 RepID=UPI0005CB2DDB|nr:PREDICTED: uncharacterized protein LOC105353132 [Fragaria vesca subsp. vesca]
MARVTTTWSLATTTIALHRPDRVAVLSQIGMKAAFECVPAPESYPKVNETQGLASKNHLWKMSHWYRERMIVLWTRGLLDRSIRACEIAPTNGWLLFMCRDAEKMFLTL